jgi:hypothetical protein
MAGIEQKSSALPECVPRPYLNSRFPGKIIVFFSQS